MSLVVFGSSCLSCDNATTWCETLGKPSRRCQDDAGTGRDFDDRDIAAETGDQ